VASGSPQNGSPSGKKVNVIVSSHLLPDIERTCDQVIVLRQGRIAAQGDIAELRATQGVRMDVELRVASDAFEKALSGRGITIASHAGSRYRLVLADNTADPGREIFQAARESGAEVRGFQPTVRSLEDIFIEAVE
jgi:ABC-2 type transport system ATP-binding protein